MSRAFRLGVFIVIALLIFAAGVFWIGNKQFLFHSTYRLNAEFQNVAGLNGGAEVRVGGIHEGTVRQIQLPIRPNEKVRVRFSCPVICAPTVSAVIAPAAAVSSFRTVPTAAPSCHKNARRAPLSSNRV